MNTITERAKMNGVEKLTQRDRQNIDRLLSLYSVSSHSGHRRVAFPRSIPQLIDSGFKFVDPFQDAMVGIGADGARWIVTCYHTKGKNKSLWYRFKDNEDFRLELMRENSLSFEEFKSIFPHPRAVI